MTDEIDNNTIIATDKDDKQLNDITDPNVRGTCFFKDLRDQSKFDPKLHHELLKVGDKLEKGAPNDPLVNTMPVEMIQGIVETLKYFGLSEELAKKAYWDLTVAKYRIWDWLGMCYTGRLEVEHDSELFSCVEKMVKLYIMQNDVGGFCWFLRGHDLECEEPHRCKDCIRSYKDWMEDSKK